MKFLVLFIVMFSIYSCYQSERDCAAFKTGTFIGEIKINGKIYTSNFVRTNTIQIETYNGETDSSEVRWINDCEVIFKTIHPKNRIEKKDVHLKILTTTDSSYTYEYSYVGESKKQKGLAIKLE